jgi:putative membrane protein
MRLSASSIGLLIGLSLIAGLLVWSGVGQVMAILAAAGGSLLLVTLLAPPEIWAGSEAWRRLFGAQHRPTAWHAFQASWMGVSVNTLLPVATVGGEVVKARVLTLAGTSVVDAAAATIVDKTVQAIVTLLWGIVGLLVLGSLAPDQDIVVAGMIGAGLLALGIVGFILVQLSGSVTFLARLSKRVLRRLSGANTEDSAARFDRAIRAIYRRPGALLAALGLRLGGQAWLVSEILLTTYLLGQAIGFEEALMLRALISAVRGLSFAIPAGLGLQEGAYIALGALIGLPADMMLALSLASRLREIIPSLPGLLLWQQLEGRRLWRGRKQAALEISSASRTQPKAV